MSDPQYQTQKTNVSLSDPDSHYFVLHYNAGQVTMNNRQQYETPLIVFSHQAPMPWQLRNEIDQAAIDALLITPPELILIGTGPTIQPFQPELMLYLHQQGIGVEVMDNHSACRTFNLIIDEGRKAVLGLCAAE